MQAEKIDLRVQALGKEDQDLTEGGVLLYTRQMVLPIP
jgi:hypothetical protein